MLRAVGNLAGRAPLKDRKGLRFLVLELKLYKSRESITSASDAAGGAALLDDAAADRLCSFWRARSS